MITSIFSTDPGKITDFSKLGTDEIFNQSILPRVNFLEQLDVAQEERDVRVKEDQERDFLKSQADDEFVSSLLSQRSQPFAAEPVEDYSAPLVSSAVTEAVVPNAAVEKPTSSGKGLSIKLSNYGYDSDSSPDYNSNVLKIGHANNPLKDGVSAALSKSLAKEYGLKTGDMFEVTTADGKTMVRRYDDTVPSTYKGRALPPTVDLYEISGNNKFGGKVVGIKPLKKS